MATILESYDWSVVSKNNKKARTRIYPWRDWFNGCIWRLEPGTDFDGPATSLERVIRTAANRQGLRVRVRTEGKAVVMQRHDDTGVLRGVTYSPRLVSKPSHNGDRPVRVLRRRSTS